MGCMHIRRQCCEFHLTPREFLRKFRISKARIRAPVLLEIQIITERCSSQGDMVSMAGAYAGKLMFNMEVAISVMQGIFSQAHWTALHIRLKPDPRRGITQCKLKTACWSFGYTVTGARCG
jgi:hypothetical protein